MVPVHCVNVQLLTAIRVLFCTQNNAKEHNSSLVVPFLSGMLEGNSPSSVQQVSRPVVCLPQWHTCTVLQWAEGTTAMGYLLQFRITNVSDNTALLLALTPVHTLVSSSLWMAFRLHCAPKGCIFLRLSPKPTATPFLSEKLKRLHSLCPVCSLHIFISHT